MRPGPAVDTLARHIRIGARILRRDLGASALAVLSLALAIGANTAVFSIAHAYLLRDWQVRSPEQLVFVRARASSGERIGAFPGPTIEQLRALRSPFAALAALDGSTITVISRGQPEVVYGDFVTGDYFPMLDVRASVGRLLTPEDDRPASPPVVVLSEPYWTTRFGADPAIVGRTVILKDVVCTIVGVTGAEYFGRQTAGAPPAITVPMVLQPHLALKDHLEFELIGRLRAGISSEAARAEVDAAYQQIRNQGPVADRAVDRHIELQSAERGDSQDDRFVRQVWMLQAVAAIVLLIAVINVASLQLARGIERQHELTVRLALGATRTDLVRQLLVESAMLSGLAGALGLCAAHYCAAALLTLTGAGTPADVVVLQAPALALNGALMVAATIVCGTFPAMRLTNIQASDRQLLLRARGMRASRAGWSLIVVQVALSIVLLVPAGLLARTVNAFSGVDLGFEAKHLVVMWIFPTLAGYDGNREMDLYARILDRLNALPGVEAASFSRYSILRRGRAHGLTIHGDREIVDAGASYVLDAAAPRFFAALGLRIVAGRDFSAADTAASTRVAVINQELAVRYFGGGRAIGASLDIEGTRREVVGIVSSMRFGVRDAAPAPAVYLPYTQAPDDMLGQMLLKIRTTGEPAAIVPTIRRELQAIAPTLAAVSIATAAADIAASTSAESSLAVLVSASAIIAVFLAMVGLYAAVAQAVRRRTAEIGVRLAVGARPVDIVTMIVRQAGALVVLGLLVGVPCALAVAHTGSSFLFGVSPADPATILTCACVVLFVTALAAYVPARRAARIDPVAALRRT